MAYRYRWLLRRFGMDRPPCIVAPYDAELFGHWWFEGPMFLEFLCRQAAFDQDEIELITPGDYLDRHPRIQLQEPSASTWSPPITSAPASRLAIFDWWRQISISDMISTASELISKPIRATV